MKSYEVILATKIHNSSEVIRLKRMHNDLHQIDMLSGEGAHLREEINQAKGIVKALEWVLNDNTEEL